MAYDGANGKVYDRADVFRAKPLRSLNADELDTMAAIRERAAALHRILAGLPLGCDERCVATAKTRLEEAVMWAIKGVTT